MEAATFRIWTQASERTREFELERNHDHPNSLSSVVLEQLQNLLSREGTDGVDEWLSRLSQQESASSNGFRVP